MYASTHRGLGRLRGRRLGDVWDSLDNAASAVVNVASWPYNAATGQLTDIQKQALILQSQDQIMAVADSPGAQVSPEAQMIARSAGIWNAMQIPNDISAIGNINAIAPANPPNYALWILLGLGALVLVKL